MPKRKRDVDTDSLPPSQSSTSCGLSRLTNTVNQGTTSLKKALILARGFERQKLGRRQKAANNEPQTLLKLREEVIVLKGLDLAVVAERQLLKRLAKVKRVRESEAWVAGYAGRGVEGVKGDAEARVVARLMGSAPVRECTDGIVERVMDVLGLEKVVVGRENGVKLGNQKGKNSKASQAKSIELTRGEDDEWSGSESDAEDEMDREEGMMRQNVVQREPKLSDVDMDDSSDFSGFSARIASSSTNSAASDSDSDGSGDGNLVRRKPESIRTPNLSIQPSASLSPSPSPSPEPKPKTKPKTKTKTPTTTTAFLPSLMMGGYYSGSSSGDSDIEDTTSNKQRKNRRGQRARQKIAEMKFGSAAKHVAKQKQNGGGQRNAGWDPKRGATATAADGNGNGRFNAKGRLRIARGAEGGKITAAGATGANGDILGSRKRDGVKAGDGPMHPSWEAARKRKEQGSKISIDTKGGGVGKKITFD